MTYFLSGGSKSGKSMLAQNIAKALPAPHYYLATLRPTDAEDRAIVARHLRERDGWGFTTLERECGILSALELAPENGTFLLDSVTALLANEMFRPDGSVDWTAGDRLANDLVRFSQLARSVVFVADFVFSDGRDYGALTEDYRSALGHIGVKLAQACGNVAELSAAIPIWYKGGWQP